MTALPAGAGHPRPDQHRPGDWWSLDGPWEFFPDDAPEAGVRTADSLPQRAAATITVPFAWETEASGIGRHWLSKAWYRREIELPSRGDDRLVVHFGAVHHACQVWLDSTLVGSHVGGQTPFEVDITDAVSGPRAALVVAVTAPVDKGELPHGKQRSIPADPYDICSFTPCSGIWQSVWLERRPASYLADVQLTARPELDGFDVAAVVAGEPRSPVQLHARVTGGSEQVALDASGRGTLSLRRPRLWSPEDPQLYLIEVELWSGTELLDRLRCTTGLRTVAASGRHLLLNGERCYVRGVLDQGYWPGSGWTAPNEAALVADLELARDAGFNLVRKHLKLEDPRWLHHADRLGMLVWEEPASTSRYSPASVAAFESQLPGMVARDRNHPCIIIWGLYNEEWGLDWDVVRDVHKQQALARAYARLKELDDSRPVIDNSGWSHVATDLTDWHIYSLDHNAWVTELAELADGATRGFLVDLGPGGPVRKYVNADGSSIAGSATLNSEYGTGSTSVERAWGMRWQTQELRRHDDLNGYVYTELYDIEHETAGVFTDHRRPKDTLGLPPSGSHADTVIVLDVDPLAPGTDVVTDAAGRFDLRARISHHGPQPLLTQLHLGWGGVAPGGETGLQSSAPLKVEPFMLSDPVSWTCQLPSPAVGARLQLWVSDPDGRRRAETILDVCPPGQLRSSARPASTVTSRPPVEPS